MTTLDTHLLLRAFVDELARCGVRHACTSPGSRSAPLVLALAREERIRCWSHLDERCAAFFALGVAKETGMPAALTCTSGTAAANFAPAVIEAHQARVPLVVLTADRPPELREVGAGQAIDQLKLYGDAAKWFFEVGTHPHTAERERWIRALACRAVWTALDGRPGPVHLNFPLREPLVPGVPLPPPAGGRSGGAPWVARAPAPADPAAQGEALLAAIGGARRGVVVLGRHERGPRAGRALAHGARALAEATGFPLLADPLSGARAGDDAVAHYDALLRDQAFAARHAPEVVVRVGDLPTSKPLRAWLAGLEGAAQIALGSDAAEQDPDGVLGLALPFDPAVTLVAAAQAAAPGDPRWGASWREADRAASAAIAAVLGDELSEPRIAAELGARLPSDATLVVASSMPVRDVETFFPVRDDPPRVLSNRGANGIDGTVSTAFGAAASGSGRVVLLIGDVALAHDLGGLIAAARLGLDLTIVLVNNDGGGIFHFLPVAGETDAFEEHVATPHGLDFAHAAALFGFAHEVAEDLEGFRAALDRALAGGGASIVEVRTDRGQNVALHRQVWEAVAARPGGR